MQKNLVKWCAIGKTWAVNDSLDVTPEKSAESNAETSAAPAVSKRRGLIGQELKSALDEALGTWDKLTEQMSDKMSPEEEQLVEVKRLLGELKSKLKEFGD